MGSVVPNNIFPNLLFYVTFPFNFKIWFLQFKSWISCAATFKKYKNGPSSAMESGPVPRSTLSFQIK